jgi:D-alanine-D-alanine ligase
LVRIFRRQTAIRIVVLYNEPILAASHCDVESERAVTAAVDLVTDQLTIAGAKVSALAIGNDLAGLEIALFRQRPDLVLNLFEGMADAPYTEAAVANLLWCSGFAFTGSSSRTLAMARDKLLAKRMMVSAGLPTPRWHVVGADGVADCTLSWPVIVKPAHEDASIGIDQGSIAIDRRQLEVRLQEMQERYGQAVLVEEYVPGREFSVAIIESPKPEILPPIEFIFDVGAINGWPILTYDSKWEPGSVDYETSYAVYRANLPECLHQQIDQLALRAFRLFDCRHYARIDFRVATDGQPYILEINPNPDLGPTACFCGALRSAALSPGDWLVRLVRTARHHDKRRNGNGAKRIARDRITRDQSGFRHL